jgi:hypothetical protein
MPPARKPLASPARRSKTFKESPAVKRLNSSLEAAQQALAELQKEAGRHANQGARDLYKDVRTFVSSARRDSRKLAKTLQRDFERAEKLLTQRQAKASRTTTAKSQAKPRAAATRTKRKAS